MTKEERFESTDFLVFVDGKLAETAILTEPDYSAWVDEHFHEEEEIFGLGAVSFSTRRGKQTESRDIFYLVLDGDASMQFLITNRLDMVRMWQTVLPLMESAVALNREEDVFSREITPAEESLRNISESLASLDSQYQPG